MVGRLFENLEQAVGRLFHKRRGSKNRKSAARLDRGTIVGSVNDLANLAQLDEQLRRVGGDDQHVGVGPDEDARFALVGLPEGVAGGDSFGYSLFEIGCIAYAGAVAANSAEVRQAAGLAGMEAVDGFGQHESQGVLPCPARAGEDERMGKTPGADTLAKMGDGLRVAEKVLKAHSLSVEQSGGGVEADSSWVRRDSLALTVAYGSVRV